MTQMTINPDAQRQAAKIGDEMDEVWGNDIYECQVRYMEHARGRAGGIHLSIKRYDREAIRDWRHLQAIKNEVCGWEREGVELFPAESRLVDSSNQYHLWVMPAQHQVPVGYQERVVGTKEDMVAILRNHGADDEMIAQTAKAQQRPWQPNISTGPDYNPTRGTS